MYKEEKKTKKIFFNIIKYLIKNEKKWICYAITNIT